MIPPADERPVNSQAAKKWLTHVSILSPLAIRVNVCYIGRAGVAQDRAARFELVGRWVRVPTPGFLEGDTVRPG